MSRPLIIDKPYPTTDGLTPDAFSLRIVTAAYASSTGELNSILQYIYHSFNFTHNKMEKHAKTIEGVATAEMLHFRLLGDTVFALGAQPVLTEQPPFKYNFYSTKFVSYSRTLRNMIEDDIMAERYAICTYERMLCRLKNERVKEIISRILEDERLHIAAFKEILCDVSC